MTHGYNAKLACKQLIVDDPGGFKAATYGVEIRSGQK
jgi:hypothetical protein